MVMVSLPKISTTLTATGSLAAAFFEFLSAAALAGVIAAGFGHCPDNWFWSLDFTCGEVPGTVLLLERRQFAVFFFYPLICKGCDKFNLAVIISWSAFLCVQDLKGMPLCAFCPVPGAFFVIVRTEIGMERRINISHLFFDVCTVPRPRKWLRR